MRSTLTCSRTFLQASLISWSVGTSSPTFSFTFSAAFSKNCNQRTKMTSISHYWFNCLFSSSNHLKPPAASDWMRCVWKGWVGSTHLMVLLEHSHDVSIETGLKNCSEQVHGNLGISVTTRTHTHSEQSVCLVHKLNQLDQNQYLTAMWDLLPRL